MVEILWHGRGGQGAFTAARLLGAAFALEGGFHYALAFPSFGPERRGAPIRAFTKLDRIKISNRSEITKADYSIFLDDTLFSEKALDELKPGGRILLNSRKKIAHEKITVIDAETIAMRVLGIPITNTIMLGALAAEFNEVTAESIADTISENMPQKLQEKNIAAVRAVMEELKNEALFKRKNSIGA